MEKNAIYRAEILDYTSDGSSIARIHDMVVFVPGGAVGDHCDIRIVKIAKNHAFGRMEKVFIPSQHRIEPECPQASKCGGCCYWHITYEEELRAKKKKVSDAMHRIGGITLEPEGICGSDRIYHYRNKAQYPIGRNDSGVVTGFYRVRSHDIIPTDQCLIQTEQADILARCVRDWMQQFHIAPYNEQTRNGLLRHIYVRTAFATGQVQLCLVSKSAKLPHTDELISNIRHQVPGLCSVMINVNSKPGNAILGEKYITLWGTDWLEDILCGNRFHISPASFYQVNRSQAERLYECALDYAALDGTKTALDLYCGVGTITLALARQAKSVIGTEIIPQAVHNARENAKLNQIENVEFFCGDSGQTAQMLALRGLTPDVICVDPPRKGLDDVTIDAVAKMSPERIVYVSCDPATLARDVKKFATLGYTVKKYRAYDLFPRTHHVETVVLLGREKIDNYIRCHT
ncbi:MAG: 23S rRNA (uracil(1939)-C(5))-methyltransferase RlmD [Eubacteriales bacterium]|nr:23S rRNA (uracil(1939)-C(5))-methyltransferase RlmD [Eubacteriales bacterium]